MNCSDVFLWQLSDQQARKSRVGAGRRDTARPGNQEGAGAGVEVRGTYCHTVYSTGIPVAEALITETFECAVC